MPAPIMRRTGGYDLRAALNQRVERTNSLINSSNLPQVRKDALLKLQSFFLKAKFTDEGINRLIKALVPFSSAVKSEILSRGGRVTKEVGTTIEVIFELEHGFQIRMMRDTSKKPGTRSEEFFLRDLVGHELPIYHFPNPWEQTTAK